MTEAKSSGHITIPRPASVADFSFQRKRSSRSTFLERSRTFRAGNNIGQIVGDYISDPTRIKGFLLDHGHFTTIAPPGSTYTIAYDINDAGQIVGNYGSFAQPHSFLWTHGQLVATDPPGTAASLTGGINRSGQFVTFDITNQRGYPVEPGGALNEIRVAGAEATFPTGSTTVAKRLAFGAAPPTRI